MTHEFNEVDKTVFETLQNTLFETLLNAMKTTGTHAADERLRAAQLLIEYMRVAAGIV